MNQLTATEQKVLNNVSQVRALDVKLGDILAALIDTTIESGTPVNAANATSTLEISGVAVDGETVTIGEDVYEFVADEDLSVTNAGNIPVDISANVVQSTGTLTMDTQPTSGDTVTIGSKTYIFVPLTTDTADGEVSIGDDLAGAKANLVGAILGVDNLNTPNPDVTVTGFVLDDLEIVAKVGGVIGDSIVTTETFTAATNIFAAGVLSGGVDCLAADAVTRLVAAITADDTQGVTATDGAGNTVVLTAPGDAGNDIGVSTDMANGAFSGAAIALAGGVDGTLADGFKLFIDDTYLYVCLDGNTAAEKNWRRVSLGSAY